MPKFLDPPTHGEKTHRFGQRTERTVLNDLGAKPTRRSGAGKTKGDGRKTVSGTITLHIEVKGTQRQSYALKTATLRKVRLESDGERMPVLGVVIGAGTATRESWVCVPTDDFNRLIEIVSGRSPEITLDESGAGMNR